MKKRTDIKSIESQEEDALLILQILNGDTNSFSKIQNKYKSLITSLIRKMIKNEDDVQDLVQETFIKVFNSLDKYRDNYAFSSWLYKLASNHCIDFLRKKRLSTISLQYTSSKSEEELEFEIEDRSNLPDREILFTERSEVIEKAIAKLPENYKLIIHLRHDEDLDYQQIADHMGIPLGTVKAHLFRARKILETYLRKYKYLFND